MKKTKRFGSVVKTDGYHYLILQILKKEKKPLSAIQLLSKIKKTKKVMSKTPDATIRSVLQRSIYLENAGKGYFRIKAGVKLPDILK